VGDQKDEDHNPFAECKVSPLSEEGEQFAIALADFIRCRMVAYVQSIESANPAVHEDGHALEKCVRRSDGQICDTACAKVMASTLPRSFDTCKHFASAAEIEIELYSQLNPIDKGIYEGKSLKEISQENPQFYQEFEENRLHTRFPGGESFCDLVGRLEPCLVEAEQQTAPVLICSHTTVLQVLYAYYRQVPIEQAMRIKIEPHTVYELSPLMGGMWNVAVYKLNTDKPGRPFLQEVASPPSPTGMGNFVFSAESLPVTPVQIPGVHV
jgi:broad specificity phosphatase PhoE